MLSPLHRRALKIALGLSLMFLVLYGFTNWYTAQRPAEQVGTWLASWELSLPYVPWLIVPYMSIDFLFFFAPFLCRDEREQNVFGKRMVFAYLSASTLFLLVPLRLAWPALPHVEGWFGDFVTHSVSVPFLMEYPHNLFPALHITHAVVLADIYGRHTRGWLRGLCYVWFVLIGLATVLTWQHHLIDVVGGLIHAGFVCYLFREDLRRLPVTPNGRLGRFYIVGALVLGALAILLWPVGVFLLWPTASLGIVAAGYFGVGPGIYRKTDGRLPLSTQVVMWPILLGEYLSLMYYRGQCRKWDEVTPTVWIGRTLTEAESEEAVVEGVTAVLDLTSEFSETRSFRSLVYRNVPVLDLTAPTQQQLREAVDFLAEQASKGLVYVHCKVGYSRSVAVVAAYLVTSGQATDVDDAVSRLRIKRPALVLRPEALEALRTFVTASTACDTSRSVGSLV